MDLNGKTVLVTGAAGFIGSHLVEQLLSDGCKVRALIRYTSRYDLGLLGYLPENLLARIDLRFADLRDVEALRKETRDCEVVFHLGAVIAIPYSYIHPREFMQVIVEGTLNVLEVCRYNQVTRLIHTSTSEVYGSAQQVPINENHILQAQSPYAACKIAADKLVESYVHSFGLDAVTVRPFNTYGPGQSARAVIPAIITQALRGKQIRIGNAYPTRDFTFVKDTVRGFIGAAAADSMIGKVVNLCSGKEISIMELAEIIANACGNECGIIHDQQRERPKTSEVDRLLGDNSQAREMLKWAPSVSLAEGIAKTIKWVESHPEYYQYRNYQK